MGTMLGNVISVINKFHVLWSLRRHCWIICSSFYL